MILAYSGAVVWGSSFALFRAHRNAGNPDLASDSYATVSAYVFYAFYPHCVKLNGQAVGRGGSPFTELGRQSLYQRGEGRLGSLAGSRPRRTR